MNFVEPIRERIKVKSIESDLKENNPRNYILLITGMYTGLRISDVLKLKVEDVKGKKQINIREKKTKKQNIIALNPILIKEFKWYCDGKQDYEYLINSNRKKVHKALSRQQAYNILRDIAKKHDISNIGTHSMRKTFGYHYYRDTKDIATLMKMFNHSDPSITLRYIGVLQDEMNRARLNFRI